MPTDFDPYYKWLGIPRSEQPPNFYRLLGINLFEADDEVIQTAAERHRAHLQNYMTGSHAEWAQKLRGEVREARQCLLNPANKAEYDRNLREQLTLLPPMVATSAIQQPANHKTPTGSSQFGTANGTLSRRHRKPSTWLTRATPDEFDPYYKWLGIPPSEQPPNYYRLLGISLFEADEDVIRTAVERHMAHLQNYKIGPQAEWSQELLSEFAQAKLCLLNRADKAKYDQTLRDQVTSLAQPSAIANADTDALSLPLAMTLPLVMPERTVTKPTIPAPKQVSRSIDGRWSTRLPGLRVRATNSAVSRWRRRQSSRRKRLALVVFTLLCAIGGFAWWRMNHTQDQHQAAVPGVVLSHTQETPAATRSSIAAVPEEPTKTTPEEVVLRPVVNPPPVQMVDPPAPVTPPPVPVVTPPPVPVVTPPPVQLIVKAPSRAKAPFNTVQARAHQEAWATHLGTKVETENSAGAKMILIPPGEFEMGTKLSNLVDETPQHRVVINRPLLIGISEVTVGQFKKFSDTGYLTEAEQANEPITYQDPGYTVTDDSPAAVITWNDAVAYCNWLSEQEKVTYRLPTEAEWEYACRAGTTTEYSFGDDVTLLERYGWYPRNAGDRSHKVQAKRPNPFGLHDMHGNLCEWCRDTYEDVYYLKSPLDDPECPNPGPNRVLRGGSWSPKDPSCRSAYRYNHAPSFRSHRYGFRLVREVDSPLAVNVVMPAIPMPDAPEIPPPAQPIKNGPPMAKAPFDSTQAKVHQAAWAKHLGKTAEITNSVDMKLVLIPAGEFEMGSSDKEAGRETDEGPQHWVKITNPFYLGTHEVTQIEYERVMRRNPSATRPVAGRGTRDFPVEGVSWEDAVEFCEKLSAMSSEKSSGRVYSLPTEAQWEYACRAGTTTPFHFGGFLEAQSGDKANSSGTSQFDRAAKGKHLGRPTEVGSYSPNAWGLHDMHGNVSEWCTDFYDEKYYGLAVGDDPKGPTDGLYRIYRGGSWSSFTGSCRSAERLRHSPNLRANDVGFRVVVKLRAP